MYGKVKIGDKEVEMLANAATPYRFKQIFRVDYLKVINDADSVANIDLFVKMGFVMAKQAAKADMAKLSEEDFFVWLEQFEPLKVELAVDQIANIFNGSSAGDASPKDTPAE